MARKKKPRKPQIRSQAIQISIHVRKPRGVKLTRDLLQALVNRFVDTGELPKGVSIDAIVWDKTFASSREGHKVFRYDDPKSFHEVLTKARQIGIWPPVFSLASE